MSVVLMGSSLVTTLLIPPQEFQEGGKASGRALAYLVDEHVGEAFGTMYDVSTIAITRPGPIGRAYDIVEPISTM
jgi:hypothetical protein